VQEHLAGGFDCGGRRGSELGGEPALDDGVGHRFHTAGLDSLDTGVPGGWCAELGGRIADDYSAETVRRFERELHSNHARHGEPAKVDFIYAKGVEQTEDVGGKLRDRVGTRCDL